MKTLLALLYSIANVATVVSTTLPINQYQNKIKTSANKLTTNWIKPETDQPNKISYQLPEKATDVELIDFEVTIKGNLMWHATKVTATIKEDITLFNEDEKKQLGETLQKGKSINFTTEASVIGEPTDWRLLVQFELPQLAEWNIAEVSDNNITESERPVALIEMIDFKMKFSYTIPTGVKQVIHFNKKVIDTIAFGAQSDPTMPAQWNAEFWLPAQPLLLFRWMDYANTWQEFITAYPSIRLQDGNSTLRTYVITQWNQDTESGLFLRVYTDAITDETGEWVVLAHSEAVVEHGNQHVNAAMVMHIYREDDNIYATFEVVSESTFTDADACEPGASASAYIGDIELLDDK